MPPKRKAASLASSEEQKKNGETPPEEVNGTTNESTATENLANAESDTRNTKKPKIEKGEGKGGYKGKNFDPDYHKKKQQTPKPPTTSTTSTTDAPTKESKKSFFAKKARDIKQKQKGRPGLEDPSRILMLRFLKVNMPIKIPDLYKIFSQYGKLLRVCLFDRGAGEQAMIEFEKLESAKRVYNELDGEAMFDDMNFIRIGYSSNKDQLHIFKNTERMWDYTKEVNENGEFVDKAPEKAVSIEASIGKFKAQVRESIGMELPMSWNERLPGVDTPVLKLLGLNAEWISAGDIDSSILANLFGVYGDVRRVYIKPDSDQAWIEMNNTVQAYVALWMLDNTPFAEGTIKVRQTTMFELTKEGTEIMADNDEYAPRFSKCATPRDPYYISSIVEPTKTLRISNIDWNTEAEFRNLFGSGEDQVQYETFNRLGNDGTSPVLVSFESVEMAVQGILQLHGAEIGSKVLVATFSAVGTDE